MDGALRPNQSWVRAFPLESVFACTRVCLCGENPAHCSDKLHMLLLHGSPISQNQEGLAFVCRGREQLDSQDPHSFVLWLQSSGDLCASLQPLRKPVYTSWFIIDLSE